MKRIVLALLIAVFVAAFAGHAAAQMAAQPRPDVYQQEAPVGLKIVDVALVRPLCVAGSIVTTATYLAISPLVYVMGLADPFARVLVEAPWRFTAFRYVGQFDHYTDEKPIMGVWELRPQY